MEISTKQLFDDAKEASGLEVTYAGSNTQVLITRHHHETPRYRTGLDESTAKLLAGLAVEFGMEGDLTARPVVKLVANHEYRKRK